MNRTVGLMKYTGHTNIANSGHFPASTVQIFPAITATTNWFTRGTPYYKYEVLLSLVKTPTVYLFFIYLLNYLFVSVVCVFKINTYF